MKIITLKTCDTCKKALKWLGEKGVEAHNHDIRADGVDRDLITDIVNTLGWEVALNRRSTTWRGLDDASKQGLDNEKAITLIMENPTMMKRPVFIKDGTYTAGFDAKAQQALETLL